MEKSEKQQEAKLEIQSRAQISLELNFLSNKGFKNIKNPKITPKNAKQVFCHVNYYWLLICLRPN